MKTKLMTVAALALIPLVLWASSGDAPMPEGQSIGRFELVYGAEPQVGGTQTAPTMFRIDTATGKTWRLISMPLRSNGGVQHFPLWKPVDEPGSELDRMAIQALQPVSGP